MVLVQFLKKKREFLNTYEIIHIRSFIHPTEGAAKVPFDKVKNCSLFLFQRGHLQYPEFYSQLPSSCRIISFPILRFTSLWPLERRDPRSKPEPEKGFISGRYPYGDSLVMKLLKRGLTAEQIFEQYISTKLSDVIDIDKIHKKNIIALKELDAKCDLPLNWYVGENFTKKRLFLTPNHPAIELLILQVNLILKAIAMTGLPLLVENEIKKNPPLETIHHPIHPQVIRHFNLQWIDANAKYRHYDSGWFTFEEYLKRYIELK
jgi:hypothetical protein